MNEDNFLSIDRLVEFGLGVAVAQQMVQSMNYSLRNAQLPGIQTVPGAAPARSYHVIFDGKPAGPFSEAEVTRLISDGRIRKDTYVWHAGMAGWQFVENVPDVLRLVALTPPPFNPGGTA